MSSGLTVFRTPVGWAALASRDEVLQAMTFGCRSADDAARRLRAYSKDKAKPSRFAQSVAERIVGALEGEPDEFRDLEIDLAHLTPFGRRVIAACRRIGWGQTRSYAELAAAAGSSGAARAVGQVMASNRTPLIVPCHRVVASGGRLGGYSAPQGLSLKRRLLALEAAVVCC